MISTTKFAMRRMFLAPVLLIAAARQACCDEHINSVNEYATTVFQDFPIATHTIDSSYIYGLNPGGAEVYVSGSRPQHYQSGKPSYGLGPEHDGREDDDDLEPFSPDEVGNSCPTSANFPSSPGSDDGRSGVNGDEEVIFPEPCESVTDQNSPDASDSTESGHEGRYLSAGSDNGDPDCTHSSTHTFDNDDQAMESPDSDRSKNNGPNTAHGLEDFATNDGQSHGTDEAVFAERPEEAFSLLDPASSSDDADERDGGWLDHSARSADSALLENSDNTLSSINDSSSRADSAESSSTGKDNHHILTKNSPLPHLAENYDANGVVLGNDGRGGEDLVFFPESDTPAVPSDIKNNPVPLTPTIHIPRDSIKGHDNAKGDKSL